MHIPGLAQRRHSLRAWWSAPLLEGRQTLQLPGSATPAHQAPAPTIEKATASSRAAAVLIDRPRRTELSQVVHSGLSPTGSTVEVMVAGATHRLATRLMPGLRRSTIGAVVARSVLTQKRGELSLSVSSFLQGA